MEVFGPSSQDLQARWLGLDNIYSRQHGTGVLGCKVDCRRAILGG